MIWIFVSVLFCTVWYLAYSRGRGSLSRDGLADLVFFVVVAFRLWLGNSSPLYTMATAPFDDRIFLTQASALLGGDWLGRYNDLTLVKGPFYSFYLAFSSWLGMSLTKSYVLFYALGAWLVLLAIRQFAKQLPVWIQVFAFCLILFCPAMVDTGVHVRAWRQPLWCILCLLVVASCSGLASSYAETFWRKLFWAGALGLSLGCAWLTREEAIWLVAPSLLALMIFCFLIWKDGGHWNVLFFTLSPLLLAPVLVFGVMMKNHYSYGFFGVVEMRGSSFVDAYAALSRVAPFDWERRIPITKEARRRIYEISPAFREIENDLENGIGVRFMRSTEKNVGISISEGEIAGGWMLWALRTAVARSGYRWSFEKTDDYYRRLASEVNRACDDGRLESLPSRITMTPRLDLKIHGKKFLSSFWRALDRSYNFRVNLNPVASSGDKKDLDWVVGLVHEPVTSVDNEKAKAQKYVIPTHIWTWLMKGYQMVARPISILASVLFPISWVASFFSRKSDGGFGALVTLATFGIILNAAVVALVDITSWNAIGIGYLGASIVLSTIPLVAAAVFVFLKIDNLSSNHDSSVRMGERIKTQHAEEE